MQVRKLAVLALGVLALAAAGCGGDESSDAAGDEPAVEETTAGETTEATETTETTDGTSTSDDVDLDDLSGECLEFAGVGAQFAEAFQAAGGGTGDLSTYADAFDELADAAPDAIADDVEVIAASIGKYAEALKDIDLTSGTPSAEDLQKLQEISASFDNAELEQASDNIEAWVEDNCNG